VVDLHRREVGAVPNPQRITRLLATERIRQQEAVAVRLIAQVEEFLEPATQADAAGWHDQFDPIPIRQSSFASASPPSPPPFRHAVLSVGRTRLRGRRLCEPDGRQTVPAGLGKHFDACADRFVICGCINWRKRDGCDRKTKKPVVTSPPIAWVAYRCMPECYQAERRMTSRWSSRDDKTQVDRAIFRGLAIIGRHIVVYSYTKFIEI